MSSTAWLRYQPNPEAARRLLCFPYSGAPPALFDRWHIPGIEVLPLALPGRGDRAGEPLVRSLAELAEGIVDEVIPLLTGNYCFLGHSMGAWLAHAVAGTLAERGLPGPARLFAVSAPPPHLPPRRFSSLHGLADADVVEEVIALGGAPESAREAIRANVDVVRADATAIGTYRPSGQLLSCPITAICGTRDPLFDFGDILHWRESTSEEVSLHLLDAGHFTVTECGTRIAEIVARDGGAAARSTDPVAVVGMACRLPGAGDPDAFWRLLRDGEDAVVPVPSGRCTDSRDPVMRYGGFLSDVEGFDAAHFGFTSREAHRSDPRLRLLLMVTQEAIDDAGLSAGELAGARTGVWVGESHSDYWELANSAVNPNMYSLSGGGLKSFLAGRVSHFFDFQGPSIVLDTSCSASLTAVHAACQALRDGEADTALAGGTHLILDPASGPTLGLAKTLSPNGRSAFAGTEADGYARAEGVAVLVLKRLSEAMRDNDPIHAVIEGSAINANGRSGANIVATSRSGQIRMMRAALADAGRRPGDIGYVEAHGPGTKRGDEIELGALHEVYGGNPQPCLVGSVKTNIGHLEPVAGLAGLIKTVLALRHGWIPPSLHQGTPVPAIDWENSALHVPPCVEPWPDIGERRAAVSSFGLSGANAHAILAEAPDQKSARARISRRRWNLRRYWYTEVLVS
ncbi:beta-ketoacyl synthase N-terminal-like domain-containing protein [Sciscionella sediminilitoris]|uniref:beta-ketoacyl synthase N-terminal-like domain-containing protein n=1 Tax=Sciscionella sediminilitoris TaxID=1445613 RepID=UPI0009EA2501|nr:beta-ketoacyl synthase N-terminal-like domain-containing protein [Sciscionella sp. SE31]